MGIQINFYLTPADQNALEGRIARVEPMTLLASRSTATPTVGQALVGASERIVYMARTADLGLVRYDYVEEQGYWYIDDGGSPVIQLIRCSLDESTLRRGRIWCEHHRLDAHGAWQQKPETFVSWSRVSARPTAS